jgi:phosphate-selective porin
MERTTSAFNLDFIARASPVADVSPGRETGIMVHGRAARRLFEYQAGVFQLGTRPVALSTEDSTARLNMVAGRVIVTPVRDRDGDSTRTLRIGLAVTDSRLPAGLHDATDRFDAVAELPSEDFYVNGRQRRYGLEGLWSAGRLTVKGELLRQAESRRGEAVTGGDLSDLVLRGGYVSGAWRLAGAVDRSRHAVDVAARFDRLTFGSADTTEPPSTSPRANHAAPLRQDTVTLGVNWFLTQWLKVQVNGIREQLTDPLQVRRHIIPGASWRGLMGVQFSM